MTTEPGRSDDQIITATEQLLLGMAGGQEPPPLRRAMGAHLEAVRRHLEAHQHCTDVSRKQAMAALDVTSTMLVLMAAVARQVVRERVATAPRPDSPHSPNQVCDCPNPRPGEPYHCAADVGR